MKTADLFDDKIHFFDGALGTEFQRRGLEAKPAPDLWTLEKPEVVTRIHRDYREAGSEVITTNTFGSNRGRLAAHGQENLIEDLNRRAVALARSVAGDEALVAGSVGPLGSILEPFGDIPVEQAIGMFREQVVFLVEEGVDLVLIETMTSLQEALAALRAAREAGAGVVAVTATFEAAPSGVRTAFGETADEVARELVAHGADIVGANCGEGLELMENVGREFPRFENVPLLMQPNAGMPTIENGTISYPGSPEDFARFSRNVIVEGVTLIGGCCGTTPDHVRAAVAAVGGCEQAPG